MPSKATEDRRVIGESSDKAWSTEKGNGKPLQLSCLKNHMSSMKGKKITTLKDELPKSVGIQYCMGEEQRNNFRRHEKSEPKWKKSSVVDVSGGKSKVQCCKEQ